MLQKMREKGILISAILTVLNFVPSLVGILLGEDSDAGFAFFIYGMLAMSAVILIFLLLYFGMEIFGMLKKVIPFAVKKGWGFGKAVGTALGFIPVVGIVCFFIFQIFGGLLGAAIMLYFCLIVPILFFIWLPILPVLLHKKGSLSGK